MTVWPDVMEVDGMVASAPEVFTVPWILGSEVDEALVSAALATKR